MDPFDRTAPSPVATTDDTARAALAQALHVHLLSGQSATATLESWCVTHALASPARVRATAVAAERPAPATVRAALQVSADADLRYRRVQLVCATRVLCVADNWYVPALLTPAMNQVLDSTDEPFGRVAAPLEFKRLTLRDQAFWPPQVMDEGRILLQLHALLLDPQQRPFSYVIEAYREDVLP